jgi:hypothetical protein
MAAGRQSKQPVGTRELPIRKAPSRARLCVRAGGPGSSRSQSQSLVEREREVIGKKSVCVLCRGRGADQPVRARVTVGTKRIR